LRRFIVRARQAPVDSKRFLSEIGNDSHVEILAHVLMNALFVAKSHRGDVVVYLVLESSQDYSRTVIFDAQGLGDLGGFHESALIHNIAVALDKATGLVKDAVVQVKPGVSVRAISFEHLVKELASDNALYILDRKGTDIRAAALARNACFILTDHIPMPRKTLSGLRRLGAEMISLGEQMLFASQCIVLIHSELDRR
jgi:tRNA (pseudouridine54-N1)-methyltransferase